MNDNPYKIIQDWAASNPDFKDSSMTTLSTKLRETIDNLPEDRVRKILLNQFLYYVNNEYINPSL